MPGIPSPQHYRDLAIRLREQAKWIPDYRDRFEKFARVYEGLAVSAEKETTPPDNTR